MDNSENFDLTILPLKDKTAKKRVKRPIDPRLPNVDDGINVILVAPPRQGKSVILANLIANSQFYKNYFDLVYIIGGTIKNDKTMREIVKLHEATTYDYFDDELINRIIKYQLQFDDDERPNALIVIDDAMALPNFTKYQTALTRLSSNYRHILGGADGGGGIIYSSQKLTSFPPALRATANTIIIGRTSNIGQRKLITDEWGDAFGGSAQFEQMLEEATKERFGFLCLYIDGNKLIAEPCAYKNFTELLYPTSKYPRAVGDNSDLTKNNDIEKPQNEEKDLSDK